MNADTKALIAVGDRMRHPGVLIVAPERDAHGQAVRAALASLAITTVQTDFAEVMTSDLTVIPGDHVLVRGQRIEPGWSVWWRRTGVPAPRPDLTDDEAELAVAETRDIVLGGLLSLDLRWVDDPYTVMRAEQTLLQLANAVKIGIRVPDTVATNQPATGRTFAQGGPILAKSISSGPGLAPYVEQIKDCDLDLLSASPTVLQRRIEKRADLRIVAIGDNAYCWERTTSRGEDVDWRAADRHGRGFVPVTRPDVECAAVAMNRGLGLSFSVQDWVTDRCEQPVFLEVNPCGAWLFLAAARSIVSPVLARHLAIPSEP